MVSVLPLVARSVPALRRVVPSSRRRPSVSPEAPTASIRPSLSRPSKPTPISPAPRMVWSALLVRIEPVVPLIWFCAEPPRVTTPAPSSVVSPSTKSPVRLPEDASEITPSLTIVPTITPVSPLRMVTLPSLVRSCSPALSASMKSPGPVSVPPTIRVLAPVILTSPPSAASMTPSLARTAFLMVSVLLFVARRVPALRWVMAPTLRRLSVNPETPAASITPLLSRPSAPAPTSPEPRIV